MKALRITGWERYAPTDAKKCKVMQWVAVPINHEGLGYIEMITRPDGLRTIGGWLLILQVAARCPVRGTLVADSGRILGPREIALKTRTNEGDISACIATLLEARWMEEFDLSGQHPDAIRTASGLQDRTVHDITGHNKIQDAPTGAEADCVGPEFSTRDGAWRMTAGFRNTLAQTFPAAPLDVEIVKAATWTHDATKKKTAAGMHRFLLNWLGRNYAVQPAPPNERPDADAMAELAAETARLRAAGEIK